MCAIRRRTAPSWAISCFPARSSANIRLGPSRTASTTRAATASSAVCASRRSSSRPEARARALITARHALDQSRDVYAVPGAMGAPQSRECNALIERCEAALLNDPRALVREYASLLPGGAAAFHAYTRPPVARTVPKQRTAPERRTPETGSRAGNGGSGAGKAGVCHAGGTG